jgi:hypothetical protein
MKMYDIESGTGLAANDEWHEAVRMVLVLSRDNREKRGGAQITLSEVGRLRRLGQK